jgi:hypothetical protein
MENTAYTAPEDTMTAQMTVAAIDALGQQVASESTESDTVKAYIFAALGRMRAAAVRRETAELADHMVNDHGWTIHPSERDDTSTLRAMHRVAIENNGPCDF